jgi:hypothetical protein
MYKIIKTDYIGEYILNLTFNDGISFDVDFSDFINEGLSLALKDKKYFSEVQIDSGGGIFWANGFDFCPNFLRDYAEKQSIITSHNLIPT